jgi:16S rRNA (uracil1498-N3)-methyltransferase
MEVHEVQALAEFLKNFNLTNRHKGLFLFEGQSALDIATALRDTGPEDVDEIWAFVGSEGGFSPQEVQLFQQHKFEPISMGGQILRTETACVAILSVLKYQLKLMC